MKTKTLWIAVSLSLPLAASLPTAPKAATPPKPAAKPAAKGKTTRPASKLPPGVVAMVNGRPISRAALVQELIKRAGGQALDFMIEDAVRRDAIKQSGVVVSPQEVQKRLQELRQRMPGGALEQQLQRNGMTMNDLLSNLKAQVAIEKIVRKQITVSDDDLDQVRARHILVRVQAGKDDAETKANAEAAKKKIDEALTKIKGGADFAQIAKEYSDDGSKDNGGDLGFFGRRKMVPEFEAAAFSQPVGAVGDPIKTMFGYHIIKVEERKIGKEMKLEDKAKAKEQIIQERLQAETGRWLQQARQRAQIQKVDRLTP
ncbi:MAG: peptidylprolyl isomerase [Armatimonadetes bacterium]|nr:peptidylprolyl isomerase [Armatimonadota bacterium]